MKANILPFLDQLPLDRIETVTFYKRDEITTDLICCDVEIGGKTFFFHEEATGWDALIKHLEQLPGFRADWYGGVSQPPFALSTTVAFRRDSALQQATEHLSKG